MTSLEPAPEAVALELLTPRGPGGVAVIAVHGDDRVSALRRVLRTPGGAPLDFLRPGPRLARLGTEARAVDQVLVVPRRDWIEVHAHASEAVLAWLSREVGRWCTREPAAAEALVGRALSEAQLALGLEQRQLGWADFVAELERSPRDQRCRAVMPALRRSEVAMALHEPVRLVLCGAQNAGKSTLMNRLLFRERALAGARAGLTRDPIRESTALAGYPYLVVDTAGEGSIDSAIDRRAVERGRAERAQGICVVVVDGSLPPGPVERDLSGVARLWVRNKADLPQRAWPASMSPVLTLSCLDPSDAPRLREMVGERLRQLRGLPRAGPVGGPAALLAQQRAQLMALL